MSPQMGMTVAGFVFIVIMLGVLAVDLVLEYRRERPLGEWVANWAKRYPLFAAGLPSSSAPWSATSSGPEFATLQIRNVD